MKYIVFSVLAAIAIYAGWRWLDQYLARCMENAFELGYSKGTLDEYE